MTVYYIVISQSNSIISDYLSNTKSIIKHIIIVVQFDISIYSKRIVSKFRMHTATPGDQSLVYLSFGVRGQVMVFPYA